KLWARTVPTTNNSHLVAAATISTAGAEKPVDSSGSAHKSEPKDSNAPLDDAPLPSIREKEPNNTAEQAVMVPIPTIVEGAIQTHSDVDSFRFQVKRGQSLAFELETPKVSYPQFGPRLGVSDASGKELFTNIYRVVAGDGDDWVKYLEPKTVFKFEQDGEYLLQIRD